MRYLICFFDSSLELVPPQYASHPQVVSNARKRGKKPYKTMLERSRHHRLLLKLENGEKRGRPDILHTCLKIVSDSPVYKRGLMDVLIHTVDNKWIVFKDRIRIPVTYDNFICLMEKLLWDGRILDPGGRLLMEVTSMESISKILAGFSRKILMTHAGRMVELREYVRSVSIEGEPVCFFIGAYPRGRPSEETWRIVDEKISVYKDVLTAWTVTAWLTYELFRLYASDI
ncbi:MAG: 16S rRNA methyltransferase [Thermoproteota archaeon]